MAQTKPTLGILTLYLNENRMLEERAVYQKMTQYGNKIGLDIVVFTPQDVNNSERRIHSMVYNTATGKWSRKWMAFPNMIYDRCRIQRSYRFEQLKKFRARYGHLTFLNRPMRNKWTVYKTLIGDTRFRPHLPLTRMVDGSRDVMQMLEKHSLVYFKPINGTGGRGILRIERKEKGVWLVEGRDLSRRMIRPEKFSSQGLQNKIIAWRGKEKKYVVQQGINLKLANGRVHDYRLLVQKNGSGEWDVTGCAGRVGARGSVTSNLHGGGRAAPMSSLLKQWIGSDSKAASIEQKAGELGVQIAAHLEKSFGQLCELALDLAIDRSGHIWLLEVNPKPAREVFARAGDRETYRKALSRPLEYALWMYEQKRRRRNYRPDPGNEGEFSG
ncbi:YheC/YheD family protein [Paenibacillaceae bacterium]|nr:YheC/YheD family protein [Paenibacillaceae bacterium]